MCSGARDGIIDEMLGPRLCVALGLLLIVPGAASAQDGSEDAALDPDEDRARRHFDSGAAYYESGDYEDALREWQRAYELSGRPALLYNLYLAYQGLADLDNALVHLERFLGEVEEIANRSALERRLEHLRRRVAERSSEAEPPQASGEASEIDPAPPPSRADNDDLNVGAVVGFSVAGVGLVGALVFGIMTVIEDGNLADAPCSPEAGGAGCGDDTLAALSAFALVTDVSFGVALAGAVLGVAFLIAGTGGDEEQARLAPWITPTAGGVTLRGSL